MAKVFYFTLLVHLPSLNDFIQNTHDYRITVHVSGEVFFQPFLNEAYRRNFFNG